MTPEPTPTAEQVADPFETLRTLLSRAHTVGQDDYREGLSDSLCIKHYDEFQIAEENHRNAIASLIRHAAALSAERDEFERLYRAADADLSTLKKNHDTLAEVNAAGAKATDALARRVEELEQALAEARRDGEQNVSTLNTLANVFNQGLPIHPETAVAQRIMKEDAARAQQAKGESKS